MKTKDIIDLQNYGYAETFQLAAEAHRQKEWIPARVLVQEKGLYTVMTENGECLAEISGRFRYEVKTTLDYPAVGDFILVERQSGDRAMIHIVLPRKSLFRRKAPFSLYEEQVISTNVDTVFLCMALNRDYNRRRLERYLSLAWNSGASPVVVLTKSDLCPDVEARIGEVQAIAIGVPVIVTCGISENGSKDLLPVLQTGKTYALIGSSGAGKSTLINSLVGEQVLTIGGLCEDGRGRHTTTRRQLLLLPNGALVIDTPGMRELGMTDGAGEGVGHIFDDIDTLAKQCRFFDCTHTSEPGCAILAALAEGSLTAERWGAYQKLQKEVRYAAEQSVYLKEKRAHFKEISKTKRNRPNKKR